MVCLKRLCKRYRCSTTLTENGGAGTGGIGVVGKNRGPLSFLPISWKQVMEPSDPLQQGLTDCSGVCRLGREGGLLELFLSRSSEMKPCVSPTGLPLLQRGGGSDTLEKERAKCGCRFR